MNTRFATLVCFVAGLALLVALALPVAANPNPNDPAYRYGVSVKNAGRSPLPQAREVFPEPLAFETETLLTPEVPASGVVDWQDAPQYVGGTEITVQGKIVDTYQIKDIVCRLNFVAYKDDPKGFYIALFKEAYDELDTKPAEYYLGKTIRVTGSITTHRKQPNLEVNNITKVEILNP